MPNWCDNYLEIEGPAEDLKAFLKVVGNQDNLIAPFYPTPEGVNWYDWNVSNWGTKWDVEQPFSPRDLSDDGTCVDGHFASAWSPPSDALRVISLLCPTLRFRLCYEETGCGFAGMVEFQAGTELSKVEADAEQSQIEDPENEEEYVDNPDYVPFSERFADDYSDAPLTLEPSELEAADETLKEEFPTAQIELLCAHCRAMRVQHVNGQCLFGPTKYTPGGPTIRVLRWTATPDKTDAEKDWDNVQAHIAAAVKKADETAGSQDQET